MSGPQAEHWRPCPEFEDFYSVSNFGRVMRTKAVSSTFAGRLLKPYPDPDGYFQVSLSKLGKNHYRKVHRLVAQAFIPNPLGLLEVNHVNGKEKWNNAASNLEWSTKLGNMQHASKTGLLACGEKHHNAKLTWGQIKAIRASSGKTQQELADEYGVANQTISSILSGKRWKTAPSVESTEQAS